VISIADWRGKRSRQETWKIYKREKKKRKKYAKRENVANRPTGIIQKCRICKLPEDEIWLQEQIRSASCKM
ncbi:hypothetical protein OAN61_00970, partial [bacterium]|nr:hypothetical protein [bacterium]